MFNLNYKVPREQIKTQYRHVQDDSSTMKYIRSFACLNYGQSKDYATHLSLKGGSGGAYNLHGPTGGKEKFAESQRWLWEKMKYDKEEDERKLPSYLVEMRGKVFPLLFDFDMHGNEDMSLNEFVPLVQCVQRLLQKIYPQLSDWQRRAIVCTAAPIIKKRDVTKGLERYEMDLIKRGFHLIYPDLITDQADALFVREALIEDLRKAFKDDERYVSFVDPADGQRVYCEKYESLVDPTVITSNGLRMIGAHKVDRCPLKCKPNTKKNALDTDQSCTMCNGLGRVDIGRPYYVLAEITGDGQVVTLDDAAQHGEYGAELQKMHTNFFEALRLCSIIREDGVINKAEPQWNDSGINFSTEQRLNVNQQEEKKLNAATKLSRKAVERYISYPGEYQLDRSKWKNVFKGHKGWDGVVELIKRAYSKTPWLYKVCGEMRGDSLWHAMGEGIQTMSVAYTKGEKPSLRAYPLINFCPNVQRVHNSNRTYFDLYFSKEKNVYFLRPGCYSTNKVLDNTTPREVCKSAHRLFAGFEVPQSVPNVLSLLLQLADAEEDLYVPKPTDLSVEPAPEYAIDPVHAQQNHHRRMPTVHKYCYICFKFVMPKDDKAPRCMCAEPNFAPKTFECQTCHKIHNRNKRKRKKSAFPWLKTEYLDLEVCECKLPSAPEEFRDTMGPDIISNSTKK